MMNAMTLESLICIYMLKTLNIQNTIKEIHEVIKTLIVK